MKITYFSNVLKEFNKSIELLFQKENEVINYQNVISTLKTKLFADQRLIANDCTVIKVVCCGRRWGKTTLGYHMLLENAYSGDNKKCWWVSPTIAQAKRVYRILKSVYNRLIAKSSDTELRITLKDCGSVIEFHSAEQKDNLRGDGIDFVVLDEAAMISENIWTECIEPALLDQNGSAIMFSTPKGRNWFYKMFCRGRDKLQKRVMSWKYPTSTSPYIDSHKLESLKNEVTKLSYLQEYEADFLEDDSVIFSGINKCISDGLSSPIDDYKYVMGVDLARKVDYTVIIVMSTVNRKVVYFERFSKVSWQKQIDKISSVAKNYNNARTLIDSTGLGDTIFEMLERSGTNIEGYTITQNSKKALIDKLSIDIERGNIVLPDIDELLNELYAFSYTTTKSGAIIYEAPTGYHDDCVIALALANFICPDRMYTSSGQIKSIGKRISSSITDGF